MDFKMESYYKKEIDQVLPDIDTGKIKIKTDNGETKWLNLNNLSVSVLIQALTKNFALKEQ